MGNHTIGTIAELPPGTRKIVTLEGRSIGVFNVHGSFYAIRNNCPHQGAPLCLGSLNGTTLASKPGQYIWGREEQILRCPWHGWEFDIVNGESIFDPHKCYVKTYEVTIEETDNMKVETDTTKIETYPVKIESDKVIVCIE